MTIDTEEPDFAALRAQLAEARRDSNAAVAFALDPLGDCADAIRAGATERGE